MSEHTSGPWEIKRSRKGYAYQIYAPNGSHVRGVTRWAAISVPSLAEGEANARLIAAAPELLAACRAISDACERLFCLGRPLQVDGKSIDHTTLNEAGALANKAIAKAEGR